MKAPRIVIVEDAGELGRVGADLVADAIAGRPAVSITAATGESPMGLYSALAAHHRSGVLKTSAVTVFQLDEYLGLAPGDRRSLLGWMRRSFLDPLGVSDEQVVPLLPGGDLEEACAAFDGAIEARGRLDIAILGLGRNGHLGFNEPPSAPQSPTRVVELSAVTLEDNARYWGSVADVPAKAVTMGLRQLLGARRIVMVVSGAIKRAIVHRALEGPVGPEVPASFLQTAEADVTVIVDRGLGRRMSGPFDLLVAGRPSLDVIFSGLHEWPTPGKDIESDGLGACAGTSFNTPAAANRIGMRVAYVATVGNDPWSRLIREEFDAEGLATDFLEIEDRPLPAVSVALNLAGDRGFVTHWGSGDAYDAHLRARALDVVERIDARHLHAYADETPELEAAAHRRGMTVSVDAWGGPWWSSPRPLAETLAHADVLFANEPEVAAMTGEAEPRRALERAAEHCECVVIKRGAAGAIGLADGQMRAVPADPVTILDTTGAGDCFNAGFLAGWLGGLPLEESLTLGVICGSRAIGDHGGYRGCPREAELRAIAAARGIALPRREAAPQGEST